MSSSPTDQNAFPFADSYWVVPGKLMAGEYPGSWRAEVSQKRVQGLIKSGVTLVIDLTMHDDSRHPYANLLEKEAAEYGKHLIRKNFPIPDYTPPSKRLMKTILDEIDTQIEDGGVVYVHCLAGIGRTGTVVGCYLVRHGLTGRAAVEHIRELRQNTSTWWQRSPESQEQLDLILSWKNGA